MDIAFVTLPASELSRIQPLWEKLNAQHLEDSKSFKEHYQNQTFEARWARFRALPQDCVHIGTVQKPDGTLAAYCVCTCEGEAGELDSIYVDEAYRRQDIGQRLVEDGIKWMKERACRTITVAVADGNEQAFGFYERLGFRVRRTVLQLK